MEVARSKTTMRMFRIKISSNNEAVVKRSEKLFELLRCYVVSRRAVGRGYCYL